MMVKNRIDIPRDFSRRPGPRFVSDGLHSGEEFRQKHLVPLFANSEDETEILIVLDGAIGYPTSFLEEAFGGLVRVCGFDKAWVKRRLRFSSLRNPSLEEEILSYIDEA